MVNRTDHAIVICLTKFSPLDSISQKLGFYFELRDNRLWSNKSLMRLVNSKIVSLSPTEIGHNQKIAQRLKRPPLKPNSLPSLPSFFVLIKRARAESKLDRIFASGNN